MIHLRTPGQYAWGIKIGYSPGYALCLDIAWGIHEWMIQFGPGERVGPDDYT